jgi:hypothetical protein
MFPGFRGVPRTSREFLLIGCAACEAQAETGQGKGEDPTTVPNNQRAHMVRKQDEQG